MKNEIEITKEEEMQIKELIQDIVSKQLEHDKQNKVPNILDELFN